MNKFNNLIKKINFFYKIADATTTDATSNPTPDANKALTDMAQTNSNIDFIKNTIAVLVQNYSKDQTLSSITSELANYYQGIDANQKLLLSQQINYNKLCEYMSLLIPLIIQNILNFYNIEKSRNATAAYQLANSIKYLNTTLLPFFQNLKTTTQQAENTPADDQEVAKLKTFLENFKPQQIVDFNRIKGDSGLEITKLTQELAKSLTPAQQNLYKAYTSLSNENLSKFKQNLEKGKEFYKNAPLTGVDGDLKIKSNVIKFQEFLNNFISKSNISQRRKDVVIPLTLDGVIGSKTTAAINLAKFLLLLPYDAPASQVYQSLKNQPS